MVPCVTALIQRLRAAIARVPPIARRVIAAGVLVLGVLAVGETLRGKNPRDVEVRMSLGSLPGDALRPESVTVTFARAGSALRVLELRYDRRSVPGELRETVSLPEGAVEVHSELRTRDRVLLRDETVMVRAGEPVVLRPPSP